jgi:hypothetical protein
MSLTSDVRRSLAKLDSSPAAVRAFSRAVGLALLALGSFLRWRHHAAGPWALGAGALLLALGLLAPPLLRPVHRAWMGLAFVLGWFTSRLVLTLLFFLVLTPLGLARRLFVGHRLGDTPAAGSAWVKKDPAAKGGYLQMY